MNKLADRVIEDYNKHVAKMDKLGMYGCPLMQDTCGHCGFYNIANHLCEYDECLTFDENLASLRLNSKNENSKDRVQV